MDPFSLVEVRIEDSDLRDHVDGEVVPGGTSPTLRRISLSPVSTAVGHQEPARERTTVGWSLSIRWLHEVFIVGWLTRIGPCSCPSCPRTCRVADSFLTS